MRVVMRFEQCSRLANRQSESEDVLGFSPVAVRWVTGSGILKHSRRELQCGWHVCWFGVDSSSQAWGRRY